jgi:uncharacterized protein (DUF2237 family)
MRGAEFVGAALVCAAIRALVVAYESGPCTTSPLINVFSSELVCAAMRALFVAYESACTA